MTGRMLRSLMQSPDFRQ